MCLYLSSHIHVQVYLMHNLQEYADVLGMTQGKDGSALLIYLASKLIGSPSINNMEHQLFRYLIGFQASIDCSLELAKGFFETSEILRDGI